MENTFIKLFQTGAGFFFLPSDWFDIMIHLHIVLNPKS